LPLDLDGNKYELIISETLDWKAARNAARNLAAPGCDSSHLATLTSPEEQALGAILMDEITENNAWLGGRQTGKTSEDKWRWITNEPWDGDDANWAGDEPNDTPLDTEIPGSEQYLELLSEFTPVNLGLWNDAPGHETKFFVVESEGCD